MPCQATKCARSFGAACYTASCSRRTAAIKSRKVEALSESESIHLAADISFLHTDYLWRMPGSWIGYPYYCSSEFYEDLARIAQRGVMDMLFFGDTGGTPEDFGGNHEAVVKYGAKWPRHDMAPMIPLMAKAASGVGFAL